MIILCKFIATPILIWLSLVAAKRWGAIFGAAIAGLPFISGPGSIFLCYENGTDFASSSAYFSLFGMLSSCIYCVAYAWLARRFHWFVCLALALCAFGVSAVGFKMLGAHSLLWIIPSLAAPLLFTRVIPETPKANKLPAAPAWKTPVQMVCGGAAVLLVTGISHLLGEFWSGVFLTFPIISSIIIPFSHHSYGADIAIDTIHGLLIGLMGTAVFNTILTLFLSPTFKWSGYAVAFSASMALGVFFALRAMRAGRPLLAKG